LPSRPGGACGPSIHETPIGPGGPGVKGNNFNNTETREVAYKYTDTLVDIWAPILSWL